MSKSISKEIKTFTPLGSIPAATTNVSIRKVRRTIAVALGTIAGAYFVALSLLLMALILPIVLSISLMKKLLVNSRWLSNSNRCL